jgi:pimeloyl-[acyl-carrier protein] methyl ester esterase
MDFLLLGSFATSDLRSQLRQAMARVSPQAVRARLKEVTRANVVRELSMVDVPILYLRAAEDRIVPGTCADEIARLARRARIAEVRAPHMILQCAPERCAELILDFAQACEAGRSV